MKALEYRILKFGLDKSTSYMEKEINEFLAFHFGNWSLHSVGRVGDEVWVVMENGMESSKN